MICHGAPTLAGIKSGNLFPCPYESEAELLAEIRRMNRILAPKGLELIPARYGTDGRALLYLYRRRALARDLEDARARALLENLPQVRRVDVKGGQLLLLLHSPIAESEYLTLLEKSGVSGFSLGR